MVPHLLPPFIEAIRHSFQDDLDFFLRVFVNFVQAVDGLGHGPLGDACRLGAVTDDVVEEFGLLVLDAQADFVAEMEALGAEHRLLVRIHGLLFHVSRQLLSYYLRCIVRYVSDHEVEQRLLLILLHLRQAFGLNHVGNKLVLIIHFVLNFALVELQRFDGSRFAVVLFEGHIYYLESFALSCCSETEEAGREDAQLTRRYLVLALVLHCLLKELDPILEPVREASYLGQYQQLLRLQSHDLRVVLRCVGGYLHILCQLILAIVEHV